VRSRCQKDFGYPSFEKIDIRTKELKIKEIEKSISYLKDEIRKKEDLIISLK